MVRTYAELAKNDVYFFVFEKYMLHLIKGKFLKEFKKKKKKTRDQRDNIIFID
jgi:hypothetical protein